MVTHIDGSNFEKEVKKHEGVVVADFWAEWCGPCKRYGPIFEEFAEGNKSAKFVKINVEEAPEVAAEFGVQSIPTTIFFKDGEPVGREVGILSKELLTQAIKHFE